MGTTTNTNPTTKVRHAFCTITFCIKLHARNLHLNFLHPIFYFQIYIHNKGSKQNTCVHIFPSANILMPNEGFTLVQSDSKSCPWTWLFLQMTSLNMYLLEFPFLSTTGEPHFEKHADNEDIFNMS